MVTGAVQGVFFRDSCQRIAASHGVRGWVRNLPDGSVEAVFEGEPDGVGRLTEWTRTGPPAARVAEVRVTDEEPSGHSGFEVRGSPSTWQP
ncbi:acylphosphatase [Streptomyces oceani]|uniref:Acylphosphatase n=1 Tax=Streptomyces oceani TaxID=1075402 RepID=A0A1E7KHD8_9ACTN|nr:acylphosphatase [Streptomyces oceani]